MNTIEDMRKELIELIRDQEGLIGDDRRQANRKCTELQDRIDCAKEQTEEAILEDADLMEQIEDGKKDDVKIQDFEELAEELGI